MKRVTIESILASVRNEGCLAVFRAGFAFAFYFAREGNAPGGQIEEFLDEGFTLLEDAKEAM